MNEQVGGATGGALSGAGTGASVGAMVGGPVGAVAGAAIGAVVGGIGGFMSGSKAKKARKYAQKAAKIQQQREQEAYRQNLLSQIRQARISRASNLATAVAAGVEEGSGAQAALSSIGSQISNVVEYMSVDRGRAVQQAHYLAKAGKNAQAAKDIMTITNGLIDFAGNAAVAYSYSQQPQKQQPTQDQQTEMTYTRASGAPSVNNTVPPIPQPKPIFLK